MHLLTMPKPFAEHCISDWHKGPHCKKRYCECLSVRACLQVIEEGETLSFGVRLLCSLQGHHLQIHFSYCLCEVEVL